jgi:hypothetical protein
MMGVLRITSIKILEGALSQTIGELFISASISPIRRASGKEMKQYIRVFLAPIRKAGRFCRIIFIRSSLHQILLGPF